MKENDSFYKILSMGLIIATILWRCSSYDAAKLCQERCEAEGGRSVGFKHGFLVTCECLMDQNTSRPMQKWP